MAMPVAVLSVVVPMGIVAHTDLYTSALADYGSHELKKKFLEPACIRDTIAYTKERRAFGRSLIHNQWIPFKLADLLTEIEALRQLNYHCVRMLIQDEDFTLEASMAKLKAGRLTRDTRMSFQHV